MIQYDSGVVDTEGKQQKSRRRQPHAPADTGLPKDEQEGKNVHRLNQHRAADTHQRPVRKQMKEQEKDEGNIQQPGLGGKVIIIGKRVPLLKEGIPPHHKIRGVAVQQILRHENIHP